MKRIIDTFDVQGKTRSYVFPIDRTVPTPDDVRMILSHADAMKAIELMLVPEAVVRLHFRVGSTPPTRIPMTGATDEQLRLQSLIDQHFNVTFICLPR